LYGAIACDGDEYLRYQVVRSIVRRGEVRRLMIVIDELERANTYILVERKRDLAAEIVFVWIVDQPVTIAVRQVLRQDSDIADVHREVDIVCGRQVGIEGNDGIGKSIIGINRDMDPLSSVLIVNHLAMSQPGEVDAEAALAGSSCGPVVA
jgi:hypothetical protein